MVTFVCDSGNKYLSKMYNDHWMLEQGLLSKPQHGDLRDLIAYRHDEGAAVSRRAGRHAGDRARPHAAVRHPRSCRCWKAIGWSV